MVTCYNCGIVLVKGENKTKEHIPPQNLFAGLPDEFKMNRITVPSCLKCNNEYGVYDEEFRDLIGAISTQAQLNVITNKTARGLSIRFPKSLSQIHFIEDGKMVLTLQREKIIEFHKKNFKGIYYKQFGHTLPNDYEILVNFNEGDWSDETLSLIGYLRDNFDWKVSGHESVFKYIIQPLRPDMEFPADKSDLELLDGEPFLGSLMIYNKTHGVLVFAVKKEILKSRK